MLDDSIATKDCVIHITEETSLLDLSQVDFDALKADFEKGRERTEADKENTWARVPKLRSNGKTPRYATKKCFKALPFKVGVLDCDSSPVVFATLKPPANRCDPFGIKKLGNPQG